MIVLWAAVRQAWEPFVLVVGLLLIGHVAAKDGLFEVAGSRLARLPGGPRVLFVAMMLLVALVTAVLNLDTSIVFLTPVLLHAARSRSVPEGAFLYGCIFMANAASLLLLGSNLTNILVFTHSGVAGTTFTATMLLPWIVSVALTTLVVGMCFRRDLSARPRSPRTPNPVVDHVTLGLGLAGVIAATTMMLVLTDPAAPVLATALALIAYDVGVRHRLSPRPLWRSANLPVVSGLFVLAVSVSVVSRHWHLTHHLLGAAGAWQTTVVAAVSANLLNNLPAAVLLSATMPAHPYNLLLGLNLGPNLSIVGALSSVLWLQVARREGASPSAWTFTKIGVLVTIVTIAACGLVL